MSAEVRGFGRQWAFQIALLSGLALVVFWGFYALDYFFTGRAAVGEAAGLFAEYLRFDADKITDAVSSFAGVMAAVFGIVVTVVSIIVQLSADRYTGVTRMFLRDRVNLAVLGYYVVACVCGVWLGPALQGDLVPRAVLVSMLIMTSGGLLMMGPYFSYVFWFLEPRNIITRIRSDAVRMAVAGALRRDALLSSEDQAEVLAAMEELTDITSNSISGKDKIIASGAVDALKDFLLAYLVIKRTATPAWVSVGAEIRKNPDFVAMDPESLDELARRRTWVEWKVMRQYLGIYNEALGTMRDICYLIAIDTRYIGEAAATERDGELGELVFRFMNSYMRATLNAREVRTAYNVLNQYRLLVEALLRMGRGDQALAGVKYMKYYGTVSYDMKLTFVTETIAYDVSALCELASQLGASEEHAMLEQFLQLDRPMLVRSQEKGLLGVRKAQVKLACYYLAHGHRDKAQAIRDDMREEPAERLFTIRQQLETVTSKDFWEIIDRGRNFEYMPPEQRACLEEFFAPLGVVAADQRASLPGPG